MDVISPAWTDLKNPASSVIPLDFRVPSELNTGDTNIMLPALVGDSSGSSWNEPVSGIWLEMSRFIEEPEASFETQLEATVTKSFL
jgi:hypothetical protein